MTRQVGVSVPAAIAMASANPARAMGSKSKGGFEVGADADFVVLSPEFEVVANVCRRQAEFFPGAPMEPA